MWRTGVVVSALVASCGGGDDAGDAPDGDVDAGRGPSDGGASPGDLGMVVFVRPDVALDPAYAYVTTIGDRVQPLRPLPAPGWEVGVPSSWVEWTPDAALSYYIGGAEGESYWLDPRDSMDNPITVAETGQRVLWSPDGTAFVSHRQVGEVVELLVTPIVDGQPGEPELVATGDYATGYGDRAWSPDGTMLHYLAYASVGLSPLMQVVSRSEAVWADPVQVPTDQPVDDEVIRPLWSPDSRSIVYLLSHYTPQGNEHALELVEVAAPETRHVLAADPCAAGIPGNSNWAPDGSRMVFWVKDPSGCRARVARRTATGWTTRPMSDGLQMSAEPQIVWSPDSRHLLRRSSDREDLLWFDANAPATDPVVVTPPAPEGSYVTEYKLSPDHSKLAILRVDGSGPSGPGERRDLYLADMSSGSPGELVPIISVGSGDVGDQIAWAPDSSHLSVEGREDSAIIEIASGAITPYGHRSFEGWSPDSRWIALLEYLPAGRIELTVRSLTGEGLGPPQVVAPDDLPAAGTVVGGRWAPKVY